MSLHFCQNPQGIRHQEWTPMWNTDCGCQWRVAGVHGLSQMHPSAGGCWWWGVLCWRWVWGTREIFAPYTLFCCELKTALKNKVYLKHKTSRHFATLSESSPCPHSPWNTCREVPRQQSARRPPRHPHRPILSSSLLCSLQVAYYQWILLLLLSVYGFFFQLICQHFHPVIHRGRVGLFLFPGVRCSSKNDFLKFPSSSFPSSLPG